MEKSPKEKVVETMVIGGRVEKRAICIRIDRPGHIITRFPVAPDNRGPRRDYVTAPESRRVSALLQAIGIATFASLGLGPVVRFIVRNHSSL